jgi:cob(I)alamin adenosyltransferase
VAIQSRLFDLGADLATPLNSAHEDKVARINEVHIQWLESQIMASIVTTNPCRIL